MDAKQAWCAPLFASRFVTFAVGSAPSAVAVTDLDGDSNLDVVVANAGSGTVSVLQGDGEVAFGSRRDLPVGAGPLGLVCGDFNGDQHPDVAVLNGDSETISILLGVGDGTFGPRADLPAGGSPRAIAMADLDGDHREDLVIVHYQLLGTVSVSLGRGDGTFSSPVYFGCGPWPYGVAIGDLDPFVDGKPDLIVSNRNSGTLSILKGQGDGTFSRAPVALTAGDSPTSVTLGELNEDGRPDIVFPQRGFQGGNCCISIFLSQGDGSYRRSDICGRCISEVAVEDLNDDGHADLIVCNLTSSSISVLLGDGRGNFNFHDNVTVDGQPGSLALGDLDGDGRKDLVAASPGISSVAVFKADRDGTFGVRSDIGPDTEPVAIATQDLDGDGTLDLVIANLRSSSVSVFVGVGDGTFQLPHDYGVGVEPRSIAIADLNGDQLPDLATANARDGSATLLFNGARAVLGNRSDLPVGGQPVTVSAADLNGDGRADLALSNYSSHAISVLLGGGDGTFRHSVDVGCNRYPRTEAVGDFNEDGRPDLVALNEGYCCGWCCDYTICTCSDGYTATVLLGHGDGTFESPRAYPVDGDPISVVIADVDLDGHLDLLVANSGGNVSLLSGNGDGTFRAPVDMIKGEGELVARSDLNMDGIPDLVFASGPYGATVSVLLGRNDGTFASPMRFGTPPGARAVAIGDFNCDGRPDLAVACTDLTTVLLNTGGTVPPPRGPASLILTPGEASLELSWLPAKCQRISGYRIYYGRRGARPPLSGNDAAEGPSGINVPADRTRFALHCLPDSTFLVRLVAVGTNARESYGDSVLTARPLLVGGRLALRPRRVNLKSRGRITATVELDPGFSVDGVIIESVRLNGVVPAELALVGDRDSDGIPDLTLRFPVPPSTSPQGGPVLFDVSGLLLGCRDTIGFVVRASVAVIGSTLAAEDRDTTRDEEDIVPSVTGREENRPSAFTLHSPIPNPARTGCEVAFEVPLPTWVRLRVFDVHGRIVASLVDNILAPGQHHVHWIGAKSQGIYFIRMEAGSFRKTVVAALLP